MIAEASVPRDLARLAYTLSRSMLDRQERLIDDLRSRTGTLLAASSLISSLLGAQALDRGGLTVLNVLALGAFAGSALICVYILLPKDNLVFSLRGSVLLEEATRRSDPLPETNRRLTYWVERFHDENQPQLDRLYWWYRWATGALVLEIGLWSLSLGGIV